MPALELLTPAEMGEADRRTIAGGTPGYALMLNAGAAVAEAAWDMAEEGRVLVVAGPGNNGGDGFVAAELLRREGRDVRVALLGERSALKDDAARAAADYSGALETIGAATDLSADLIIDALFGAGLARPLGGEAARVVEALNASGTPVLAIDLPSGIDGRTGAVQGVAIRATRTVSFFRLKPGHLLLPGRLHCGRTELAQIGIPDSVLDAIHPATFHNLPSLWGTQMRPPRAEDHKYSRGHAFVVSGPMSATGAARLAAMAALRAGAGAVTVASPPDALLVNAAHLTAIMVRAFDGAEALGTLLSDPRPKSVAVGPANGVGESTRRNVAAALASDAAVVLDADALTSFTASAGDLFARIKGRTRPVVMTPHQGEFGRLFPQFDPSSRLDSARAAARESGACVVLKGYDTVIAAPDGRAAINDNAPADLATAGSGDVLTGIVAGLLAQGLEGFDAACAGVWIHGAAGAAVGRGLIAEDLPAAIPGVLRSLERDPN
jgi:ADP-dependent NAD(P)H-hydrate dehydratase / NAD(P)H-hydrate epimerase